MTWDSIEYTVELEFSGEQPLEAILVQILKLQESSFVWEKRDA